ncbi:TetR/AcrR family transcriptional regulator [Massilimicrobiota sp. An134]|uniref:TetR/AcrR family transcriptional regulator n=1 Tax=Massilimicrobiota sp. An134 TaxID=1965557 RepID=UPI000B368D84|nr:TetR/AcrR family transcriptional regulator [Massilimicrobiota sp. An134]OUQ29640.1 TetR family transcriptional regulator [Massilimicrobiota sp. An134]
MARNKHPEVTVGKILEVSKRLFLEKGYDNTKIQDIADELGMTKGAIYHHFESKEEIMNKLGETMFIHNNPFEIVKKRNDLNGLEKMKLAIKLNQSNEQMVELTNQALPLLENPQILAKMFESNYQNLLPYWLELIQEGQEDGSIKTEQPKELAELFILTDLWMIPSLFPGNVDDIKNRYKFVTVMLGKMGLPLFDEEMIEKIDKLPYYK